MRSRNADFACAVTIVGLLAGVAGLATTTLLRFVEHLTYNYTFGSLLEGVSASSPIRQAVGPMIGGGLAGLGWWILRSRTEVAAAGRRGRASRAYSVAALHFRRRATGAGRRLRCVVGSRSGASPVRSGAGQPRDRMDEKALGTRPRDPAGVCGRGRTGCGVRGATRWRIVHAAHHVEELASPRGGRRADHVEPGRLRVVVRHPRPAEPGVAQPGRVLPADRVRGGAGPVDVAARDGVQSGHGMGGSGASCPESWSDPGDRRRGIAGRCVLTLVARTARQRPVDPQPHSRRRDDAEHCGDNPGSQTRCDGDISACGRPGRVVHPGAGDRCGRRDAVRADDQRDRRDAIPCAGHRAGRLCRRASDHPERAALGRDLRLGAGQTAAVVVTGFPGGRLEHLRLADHCSRAVAKGLATCRSGAGSPWRCCAG